MAARLRRAVAIPVVIPVAVPLVGAMSAGGAASGEQETALDRIESPPAPAIASTRPMMSPILPDFFAGPASSPESALISVMAAS